MIQNPKEGVPTSPWHDVTSCATQSQNAQQPHHRILSLHDQCTLGMRRAMKHRMLNRRERSRCCQKGAESETRTFAHSRPCPSHESLSVRLPLWGGNHVQALTRPQQGCPSSTPEGPSDSDSDGDGGYIATTRQTCYGIEGRSGCITRDLS
jgi:hypothetical protein